MIWVPVLQFCNRFEQQLATSVDLPRLMLRGLVCVYWRRPEQDCSIHIIVSINWTATSYTKLSCSSRVLPMLSKLQSEWRHLLRCIFEHDATFSCGDVQLCNQPRVIDVSIERECTIDGDTETSKAFSYSTRVSAKCNIIICTFRSMSHTGDDDDSLWFVRFSDKPFSANQTTSYSIQLMFF